MDTRIWMQESFWESAEKQSVKESPQENAGHLSKDQNENGGNKLVDQKTSLWKQTYENILVGMGFCVIKLNFLLLYYILPFIGILMIFAGLRKLKQEDKWFKAGYAAAAINVVITMISIVSGTFINRRQIYDTYIWQFMLLWTFALPLIIASCFFCGMQTELKKREKEADNKILIHLVIWYAVVILLMNMNDSGWIIGIAVLATYIGILVELKHTAENLEKAGYVLEEPPMRVSNGKCAAGAVVLTAAGLVIGTIFFGSYHMRWNEVKAPQDPAYEEIKTHLVSIGFPEDILDDLKEEDLLACKNARQVRLQQTDYPINDGEQIVERSEGYTQYSREYPHKELRLSGIAVELEQEGHWKIIHHFLWNEDPVMTAAQNRKQGGWLDNLVFFTVQDALQVLPGEETD